MKLLDFHNLMQRLSTAPIRLSAEDEAIVQTMKAYFDEMYDIEREDEGRLDEGSSEEMLARLNASIKRQELVHEKYWCNESPYYAPNSTTSDPDHDWKRVAGFKVLRNGDDNAPLFLFLYGYVDENLKVPPLHCYALRIVDGKPMIEHVYF